MNEGISRIASLGRLPRLLIVQKNFEAFEPLIRTCGDKRLDVHFDVCSSPYSAVGMLLASPYQLIISGAHIAEMDDFLLLKRIQAQESFVPVVVTASASEKEAARRVLAQGAFDLLPSPLDHEQTVGTIRLALWQGHLRNLIARKDAALEKYQQHLADYPDDRKNIEDAFHRATAAFEKTISSVAKTILRIEESTVCFADFASQVEYHARKRALERLDSKYGPPPATILLVDPHKEDREYWKQRLKLSSPEAVVLEADTGKAALAICHVLRVDCVVTELTLPDMLGVELLVNLVPRAKRPEIPVIVLSLQFLVPESVQVALNNGAQACLVKSRTSGDNLDKAIQHAIAAVGPRKEQPL